MRIDGRKKKMNFYWISINVEVASTLIGRTTLIGVPHTLPISATMLL